MNINTLAKLTLLGLAYVYTVKLIDTIYHGIFRPSVVAMVVVGLNILAGLIQLLFFIALYRQFVPKHKQALTVAAWLAMIGSAISMLPKFLALTLLLQKQSLFFFIGYSEQIRVFCPWTSSVLLFLFSLIFLLKYRFKHDRQLNFAFAAGMIGWFIMASTQSLVVVNYLTAGRLSWLTDLFTVGPFLFVAASSLTLLGLSIFYLAFARR